MQAGHFLELKQFMFVKEMTKYQLSYFKSCSVIRKEPLGLTGLRSTPFSSVDSFPSEIHIHLRVPGSQSVMDFSGFALETQAPPSMCDTTLHSACSSSVSHPLSRAFIHHLRFIQEA